MGTGAALIQADLLVYQAAGFYSGGFYSGGFGFNGPNGYWWSASYESGSYSWLRTLTRPTTKMSTETPAIETPAFLLVASGIKN